MTDLKWQVLPGAAQIAARMLLEMAGRTDLITAAELSRATTTSLSYTEQICHRLKRANLITSWRGPGGGYRLAKPAIEMTVGDVFKALGIAAGPPPARAGMRKLADDVFSLLNNTRVWDLN